MKYQTLAPKNLNLDLINSDSEDQQKQINYSDIGLTDCQLCLDKKPLKKYLKELIHNKYFETFNFYFAKPINEILANVPTEHVILFKDYLFYYDDNEYLKRYYRLDEVPPRMNILSEFYTNQYKETRPNLSIVDQHRMINKRNQKSAKLFLQKFTNKNENSEEQSKRNIYNKKVLPERIFSANYTPSLTSENESYPTDPKLYISWETESHNIYEITEPSFKKKKEGVAQVEYNNNQIVQNVLGGRRETRLYQNESDSELGAEMLKVNELAGQLIAVQMNLQQLPQSNMGEQFRRIGLKQRQGERKSPPQVPQLKIPEVQVKSKAASARVQETQLIKSLMKKYDSVINRKFNKGTISDEVLLKIYRQHVDKIQKKQLKSEQSVSPKKKSCTNKKSSKRKEGLANNNNLNNNNKKKQKSSLGQASIRGLRDSQSSENSGVNMKNQYHSQACYKNPTLQYANAQESSGPISNTFENFNEQRIQQLIIKKSKQDQSRKSQKVVRNKNPIRNVNFSQLTVSSPSTTQLIQTKIKKKISNQSNNFSKQEQQTVHLTKHTCSPSLLLRSISSSTQSPARRIEIKVNLNKLIQKQEQELQKYTVDYWTQRESNSNNNNNEIAYQTERIKKAPSKK